MSLEFESEDLSSVKHRARDRAPSDAGGRLMQSSSESEAGMVDRESHGTAEAGDRDRGWKSSGRRKTTGKHRDWRGRGEERGGGNGERRKERGANVEGDIRVADASRTPYPTNI
jgi:hypothetical protein